MDAVDGIIWAVAVIDSDATTDLVDPAATRRVKLHRLIVIVSVAGTSSNISFQFASTVAIPALAIVTTSIGVKLDLDFGAKGFYLGSVGDDLEAVTASSGAATLTVLYAYSLEGA